MDPTGGLNAVAAVVSALELRERTGRGCRAEVAQVEAAAHWIGEYVLEQVDTGRTWRPGGNHVADAAPHDAFPCRGDDQWIAIAVTDDRQWRALCEEMRRADLAADPRYATAAARSHHRAGLDDAIRTWTRPQDNRELAERLQRAGVPAAPVLDGAGIAADPAMWTAGLVAELDHPRVGRRAYSTLGFRHTRTPGGHRRAAPLFGEHNDAVLHDLLGYDPERIARLRRAAVIADRPTADTETPPAVMHPERRRT
jgi:crotonobetainyl-CoA:carnitine CoA-transferase CaiB-like acyl-CoA transferase